MKISRRDGLRVLIDFGIGSNLGWAGELASKAKLPSKFLELPLRCSHTLLAAF
jgi:hypothetical protein